MVGFGYEGTAPRRARSFPAYGPVDTAISYAVFYIFVDYATPTVVDAAAIVFPSVSPSSVRFGLAALLWFVLVVTLLDQARRQLAALGVGVKDAYQSRGHPGVPSATWMVVYGGLALVGGAIASLTFDRALETGRELILFFATLDLARFVPADFVLLVVFFVSFGVATFALDRLVIGGVRAVVPPTGGV
ncbi:hypothetical protein ACFQJC_07385 [Haloferax namakaokahaiae]|uniref:Uncharacterized protein n=1 Tax=Haloferax namakaokahaiae TaxID=1748331 RepID=A0ABD5ZDG0_9EURY